MDQKTIGERIAAVRTKRGFTQDQLAALLEMSRGRIANYEQGTREPDFPTLKLIAKGLNVQPEFLLGRVMYPNSPELYPYEETSTSKIPITTEPLDTSVTRMNNPAMDEIMDNLQQMSQDDIENFRRLTRSVVNRKTKGVS